MASDGLDPLVATIVSRYIATLLIDYVVFVYIIILIVVVVPYSHTGLVLQSSFIGCASLLVLHSVHIYLWLVFCLQLDFSHPLLFFFFLRRPSATSTYEVNEEYHRSVLFPSKNNRRDLLEETNFPEKSEILFGANIR